MKAGFFHAALVVLAVLFGTATAALAQKSVPADPPGPAIARDVRLGGDAARTRFVMDLDRGVPIRVFTIADPYRVVIDLPDVRFDLPAESVTQSRGLVTAYRFGLFAPGKARIVIDVAGPVAVDKSFVLDALDDQPARLVLDLVKSDRASFMEKLDGRRSGVAQPAAPADASLPAGDLPVVVVDPGHGGIDPGASSAAVVEKDIVLAFARQVRDKLEAAGRYRVVMTRQDDTFVPLGERVQIARRNNAALFISIHADTLSDPFGVRGATIYTMSDRASDEASAKLAEKENRVDLIAGMDLTEEPEEVAGILFELARRETRSFAMQFARSLVGELKSTLVLNKNPMRSAGFKVLKAPDVPSVLLELGYVSNPEDVKVMISPEWRTRAADSLVAAVGAFFAPRMAGSTGGRVN